MGRKPIPNEMKKLRGTDQPCRMRPTIKGVIITDAESVMLHPSVMLLSNDRQKQIFVEKVGQLVALKMMEEMYVDALVQYAVYYDLWEQAVISMRDLGQSFLTRRNDAGKIIGHIENPYIRLAMKYRDIVNSIGSEFGFTPVSRMKLPTPGVKESPLEQIRKIVNGK